MIRLRVRSRTDMRSVADSVGNSHERSHLRTDIRCAMNSEMMNKESAGKIVDSVETGIVVVRLCQHEVYIDEISADPVDRTEPHFREKCHSRLHRMKLELAYPAILSDEVVEQMDRLRILALQE